VASSGHTLIFVPSYFDFLRVEAYLKTIEDLEYTCISECVVSPRLQLPTDTSRYSSNSDIARARNAFLAGKLPFLVITERFHFFKRYVAPCLRLEVHLQARYRIRGAKTIVFYALPDHALFYQEIMTLPFEDVVGNKYAIPDEAEVTCQAVFSQFDTLKLERIVGAQNAQRLLKGDDSSYTFA
jgi:U3 small nucleolar RNA-associated protein 25